MISLRDAAHKVLQFTHGRTTAFFLSFFVAGHAVLAFGKLTTTYVYFMATLGGLVLGHSIKEDIAAKFGAGAGSTLSPPEGRSNVDDKN
jgi:hypothetical protein